MMKGLPRVTVVMPSYNQAQFLEEAVQSVLDQAYPNLEFMVLDGGSTDQSASIVHKYASHLSYWRSHPDEGQTAALIEGFGRSTGSLLTWVNSDDLLLPCAVWTVARAHLHRPSAGLLGGNVIRIDEWGRVLRCNRYPHMGWLRRLGLLGINQSGTFFTREAYLAAGGLRKDLTYVMDFDLWVRMLRAGIQYAHVNAWLGAWRWHAASKSIGQRASSRREYEAVHVRSWTPTIARGTHHRLLMLAYRIYQVLNGNYLRMELETFRARGQRWDEWANVHCTKGVPPATGS